MKNERRLFKAIECNDIIFAKHLLSLGTTDLNIRSAQVPCNSLLHFAAQYGRLEITTLLLDAGAQIDATNYWGDTALHIAVRLEQTSVVELLVARNARVSIRNQWEMTPIALAAANDSASLTLIDAAISSRTPLDDLTILYAATVSIEVIQLLIFKARINLSTIRGINQRTPIHQAVLCKRDKAGLIAMLVEIGNVDIDAYDQSGCTAVHYTCFNNDSCTLSYLITAGANVDLRNNVGSTPLYYSWNATPKIVYLLLAAGANVNAKNNEGRTPLHSAYNSISALLAFGANLDEQDNNGITPRDLLRLPLPTTEEIELERLQVIKVRLSLIRKRASDVCIGLQSLGIDALCMCEILLYSCGPIAPLVSFHHWWQIATKVKHFRNYTMDRD